MENLMQQANSTQAEIDKALMRLHFEELVTQKREIDKQIANPHFWNNPQKAQEVVRQQSKLERRIAPWENLKQTTDVVVEFANLGDETMLDDLRLQLQLIQSTFAELKDDLKFSGPYDDHDVIVNIYAGAGGTDAQDWAHMLLRMYVRWAEAHKCEVKTVDESAGDEAGIKSATLEISGPFVYGRLKGEHGVHRLVRLSPFNSDNLRQTSFAKVDILPKVDSPDELVIDDKDLRIDVYRSGGHGGQSVNTTDSAVRVTHIPTGISVAIQNERSQLQNKDTAMKILRSKLVQLQLEQHAENISDLHAGESANWGSQIRNYVLHPYTMAKDTRTKYEDRDVASVLDGKLDGFMTSYLEHYLGGEN